MENDGILNLDDIIKIYTDYDKIEIKDKNSIIRNEKEKNKAIRDNMLKRIAERQRTWVLLEIVNCLEFGYKVVYTANISNSKSARYSTTDPEAFYKLCTKYSKKIKPRYLSYKEKLFMLVEKFELDYPEYSKGSYELPRRVYERKNTPEELHRYLLTMGRMTKANFNKIMKGWI